MVTVQISFKKYHGISNFSMIWAMCRGRRVHTSGHSDVGLISNQGASSNITCVYADTASVACPSQFGNLATTLIIFAAVIWDADELCSVKTARAPESSFTMSSSEHDSAFALMQLGVLTSHFLRWHMSINDAKWTFLLSLSASRITSFFALHLVQLPSWCRFELLPFLVSTAAFCILYLRCDLHSLFVE